MSGVLDIIRGNSFITEDFVANDSVADAAIGEQDWEVVAIANASTWANQTGHPNGVARSTTAAVANGDGSVLRLFADGLVVPLGTELQFRARLVTDVLSSLRIGFDDSETATDPTKGIGFKVLQGVVSCFCFSANGSFTQAVTAHPDLTSGTTLVAGSWVKGLVRASGRANANGGPDEVDFYLNGLHVAKLKCLLGSTETLEAKIAHWQASGGAAAKVAEFDSYRARLPVLT